ncbi:hypothetical protein GWI33_013513 [Rhynchophorus ferrugineus]|uniref:Uncharacterized protein n=1 Tax=Rhynchophorus ferrugineus TaxID=354439 RepID=A0A834MBI4_RHYFE|nr:hypothetical protein GWI33_013513 [Rhynchophorus ferrugineus]
MSFSIYIAPRRLPRWLPFSSRDRSKVQSATVSQPRRNSSMHALYGHPFRDYPHPHSLTPSRHPLFSRRIFVLVPPTPRRFLQSEIYDAVITSPISTVIINVSCQLPNGLTN